MSDELDLDELLRGHANPRDCGVCLGLSPSWDGHDINPPCRGYVWDQVPALVAEVAALRRQIEPLQELAQRIVDMDDPRGSEDRRTITLNALIGQALAALSSVPDVPAEHRRTDPACVFHETPDPGSRLDEESRGLSCPVCIPEATR